MIYILHYDKRVAHSSHYSGWSKTLPTLIQRIKHHRNGTSRCNYTTKLREAGNDFIVAAVFVDGERLEESWIKNRVKHTPRMCYVCSEKPYVPYGLHAMSFDELVDLNAATGRTLQDAEADRLRIQGEQWLNEMIEEQAIAYEDCFA